MSDRSSGRRRTLVVLALMAVVLLGTLAALAWWFVHWAVPPDVGMMGATPAHSAGLRIASNHQPV